MEIAFIFWFDHLLDARVEIRDIFFVGFLVELKTQQLFYEIFWPLYTCIFTRYILDYLKINSATKEFHPIVFFSLSFDSQ